MAKNGKKRTQTAPAKPQAARTAAVGPDTMRTGQLVAWIALNLLVFVTPVIISNWTAIGVSLPLTYDQFDIIKVFSQRLFTLIAFGAWAWDIFVHGGKIRRSKIDYLILALLAWVLLTTFTSISWQTALFGKYRRFEGLLAFVNYAAIFFLVMQFADRASRVRTLAKTLFFSGAIVSFYGVLQYFGLDPIKWGSLPFEANRAFSTYGNPDMLGAFLIFPLIISLALALSESDIMMRIVYWLGFLLAVAAWIVAFTRGAWIGGAFGLGILIFVAFRHRVKLTGTDYGFMGAIAAMATGLIIVSLSATSAVMNVWLRLRSIFNTNDGSSKTRFEIWQAAIDAIKDRPIFGFGADTFRLVFPKYKPAKYVTDAGYLSVADNVHNYPLQITTALGIPGFLLLYGTFGAAAWFSAPLVFKRHEGSERLVLAGFWAACAGYLASLSFGISVTGNTFLLWAAMAVVLAPLAKVVEVRRFEWGVFAAAVSLVLVAVLIVGSFVYISADSHYLKARLVAQGQTRVDEVEKAIELNPFNDMYRAELGLAHMDNAVAAITQLASGNSQDPAVRALAQSHFDKAERAFLDVIDFVPWEYDNYVFITSLYSMGAEYLDPSYGEKAVEYGEKGVAVEPYGPAVRFQLARALMRLGRDAEAKGHLETAVKLDPKYTDAWVLLGDLNRATGDYAAARDAYQAALKRDPNLSTVQANLAAVEASIAAGK